MATNSTIEWTQKTWNPVLGFALISSGCRHCYAMAMARRLKGIALAKAKRGQDPGRLAGYGNVVGANGRWNGKVMLVPQALEEPFSWKRPSMVFVNSMSDLFHEDLAVMDIAKVCQVMSQTSWHTFQVLTKRADQMVKLLTGELSEFASLVNVWWGVSVENRSQGLPRINQLQQLPGAAVRFLSCEPLLEDLGQLNLVGIGWVIVGSESGPGAREMKEEWVRSIRDQCLEARVPFFFKQASVEGKKVALPMLDGKVWDEMPALGRQLAS